MSDFKYIQLDRDLEGIATLTLNRPQVLNAFHAAMAREVCDALNEIDAESEVKALIITGSGRAFCAGADLSVGAGAFDPELSNRDNSENPRDFGGVMNLRLFESSKPVIAAINGPAVGIGATMTLPCDIRIASASARIGFVFSARGIVADGCASWFLPRVVGISTAMEWCMTGRIFAADEALSSGLVRSLHKPDELMNAARGLALSIATNSAPVSTSLTRSLLWRGLVEDHPMAMHRYESRLIDFTGRGPDAREGVTSFLEKRPANFPGRVPRDLPTPWPAWTEPTFETSGEVG